MKFCRNPAAFSGAIRAHMSSRKGAFSQDAKASRASDAADPAKTVNSKAYSRLWRSERLYSYAAFLKELLVSGLYRTGARTPAWPGARNLPPSPARRSRSGKASGIDRGVFQLRIQVQSRTTGEGRGPLTRPCSWAQSALPPDGRKTAAACQCPNMALKQTAEDIRRSCVSHAKIGFLPALSRAQARCRGFRGKHTPKFFIRGFYPWSTV